MTVLGQTHSGSIAERAIALLKERGLAMRSKEIADALEASPASIAACLEPHVENGTLVRCKVTSPAGRPTNEYRISGGGKPPPWKDLQVTNKAKSGFVQRRPAPEPRGSRTPAPAAAKPSAPTPRAQQLELTDTVPNPGLRFGKQEVYRNTLLAMKGNDSFVLRDATMVYPVAKKLGIKITTRQEGDQVRVWRVS